MMSTKIEGGLPPATKLDIASCSGIGRAGFTRSTDVEKPAAVDNLRLTDDASELRSILQRRLGEGGVVDQARVEQFRGEIRAGTYRVDHGAIADRMIALEREISR